MKTKLFILVAFILSTEFIVAQSDNCATATVLTLDAAGNVCTTGTTTNATSANVGYGACNPLPNTNNEVWYTYVSNGANNQFDLTPQGMTNPEIVIYTGGCAGTLQTCNTQVGTALLTTSLGVPLGTQVWIGIMSNQGAQGGFDFCINSTPPAATGGNLCATAIPICDAAATTTIDMNTVSSSGVFPSCFLSAVNQDVWFQFTVTQSGTFEWSATPGAGSTNVELDWALFDVTAGCPGTEIDCNYNYDAGGNNPAGQTPGGTGEFNPPANVIAGNTYAIIVDFYSNGGVGDLDFNVGNGTALIAPDASFTVTPTTPVCGPSLTATITDNSFGGVPTWDFGDGSAPFVGNNPPPHIYTTPGSYAITATIAGTCPSTHTEFVQLFGPVVPVATTVLETCAGDCDGSISIATSGGSGNYTYLWTPGGQTTPAINGLCANSYSVTVTDAVCGNVVLPVVLAAGPVCVTCAMDSLTIVMTNCNNNLPTLTYDVSGEVYYSDPPTTGTLTITDCNGGIQVFNAPFGTPQAFTFTGLPHTGNNCDFTAVFSDNTACTITTSFMSPIPITFTEIPDCQDSSVTFTISGGLPATNGSLYTTSNLLPTNASFINNTTTHGGNIVINGLLDGDMYSFDITDNNGCPIIISGGPFLGLPNANANVDDTSCTLTYNLNAIPSIGTGAWTGSAGVTFAPANSPTATVTVPSAGTYTFTWTEDNTGGCISSDDVTVLFNILSLPNTPTDPLCNGGNDGQIILAPQGGTSPYSYLWDAAANNQITNPATNLPAGSYTVTVTDNFGCFLDSTFTLNEPTPFTFTTDSVASNCGNPDGSITVVGFAGGTPGYTYDWGAGPVASNTLTNLIPGNYTVTVADNNGCDTIFDIIVGNNPSFTASITASTNTSCNGFADGSATADGSDPLATYSFQWNAAAGNQATQTANGLAAGTYIVTVTDPATGCTDTASIIITEPNPVIINTITPPTTICIGQNTNITATAIGGTGSGYTYNWDNGLGAGQTHNVNPITTTTYIVTAADGNGCPSIPDTVIITVNPPLTILASADVNICPNGQAQISAVGAGGNGGPYTYSWDNGLGIGQNQQVSPSVTTTYVVTFSDNCSPDVYDTVTVYMNPTPVVDFSVDTLSICETPIRPFEFYNLTDTTGGMVGTTFWDFGDNGTGSGDTISHTYQSPGTYDVTLTVTSSTAAGGCTNSLTKIGYVQVFSNPTANFTSSPTSPTMFDPTVNFIDQSYSNIQVWNWNIAGLDSSSQQNPSYTFPEDTGTYLVILTVTDGNGCMNNFSNYIVVRGEYGIYVPNAFTPDADGLNDGFSPAGFGISDRDYVFKIYDRWGEMIFETYTKFEPWFGDYKGKLVPNDVYIWQLSFKDINGVSRTETGRVSVVK